MSKGKKYDYQIIQDKTSWTVEIRRQVTSKKTVVSKSQYGFSSEADAQAWGKSELESFMKKLNERNKQRSKLRKEKQSDS